MTRDRRARRYLEERYRATAGIASEGKPEEREIGVSIVAPSSRSLMLSRDGTAKGSTRQTPFPRNIVVTGPRRRGSGLVPARADVPTAAHNGRIMRSVLKEPLKGRKEIFLPWRASPRNGPLRNSLFLFLPPFLVGRSITAGAYRSSSVCRTREVAS